MTGRPNTMRLARLAGIEVYLHFSWVAIAVLIVVGFWGKFHGELPDLGWPATAALALAGTALFFGSVLAHELAHAVMARRHDIDVGGITLYLFGGSADADPASRSAADEFAIAVIGPATSLVLAAVLGAASLVVGPWDEPIPNLLGYLAAVNLVVAMFNLAPGLPLDGGRVLRSTVWAITGDFERATRWATAGGVGVGYLLIGVGLGSLWRGAFAGLWLVVIGWIVSQNAMRGESRERWRAKLRSSTARHFMTTPVVSIPSQIPVAEAAEDYFARWPHTGFPVLEGRAVIGLLTVDAVRALPPDQRWDTTVDHLAETLAPALIAEPDTPTLEVVQALSNRSEPKARVLVMDGGELVGIISPADILRRRSSKPAPT